MVRPKDTPNDPDRRQRIVTAAVQIVRDGGIGALTARAAAAEAEVPLGSVGYHFGSVRELLADACTLVLQERSRALDAHLDGATATDLIERLARLIEHQLTAERAATVVAYELQMLGMHDAELRAIGRSSLDHLRHRLAQTISPDAAEHLAAVADGYQLQCLFHEQAPGRRRIATVLRAALPETGPRPSDRPPGPAAKEQ